MTVVSEKLDKLIKNQQRGLILSREAANSVLMMLVDNDSDDCIYDCLSQPIKTEVESSLGKIAIDGIQWRPLLIGEPLTEDEIERINDRLKQFFQSLEE